MVYVDARLAWLPDDAIKSLGESAQVEYGPSGQEWAEEVLRLRAGEPMRCFSGLYVWPYSKAPEWLRASVSVDGSETWLVLGRDRLSVEGLAEKLGFDSATEVLTDRFGEAFVGVSRGV